MSDTVCVLHVRRDNIVRDHLVPVGGMSLSLALLGDTLTVDDALRHNQKMNVERYFARSLSSSFVFITSIKHLYREAVMFNMYWTSK